MNTSNQTNANDNCSAVDGDEPQQRPWTPPRGPLSRAISWLILIFIAIILLGMLAAVFGT